MAIWHMLQGFMGVFPQYVPTNGSMGVHLFTESYGGKYGPAFATLWEQQNLRRSNASISPTGTIEIKLESLGIINGCVDDLVQSPYYPEMAVNNTYGLTAINPTRARLASASFYASGGCQDLINQCRTAVKTKDPENQGNVSSVSVICASAYTSCTSNVMEPYYDAGRSVYDISHYLPDAFPPSTYLEYLNTPAFQEAIGSPVNYTETNYQVVDAFTATGDYERESFVPAIAALLNSGVRVGLMYGDRDYICNWLGGEAISLAVAAQTSPQYASLFPAAGYAPIIVNGSYIGGAVRQYGNLSFSRIYDAGHSVPAYQPETAFQVFARILMGTAISSGEAIDISSYSSSGPLNASQTNSLPASPSSTCYLRNIPETCTSDERQMIVENQGVIINGILYSSSSDWSTPAAASTVPAGSGGSNTATATPTTGLPTGFYTATSTPTPSKKSVANLPSSNLSLFPLCLPILLFSIMS